MYIHIDSFQCLSCCFLSKILDLGAELPRAQDVSFCNKANWNLIFFQIIHKILVLGRPIVFLQNTLIVSQMQSFTAPGVDNLLDGLQ